MDEMREFAIKQAEEARDVVAEELFRRASRIDIDLLKNEYENIVFYFDFAGATVYAKWNCDDRFNDPDVVYDIMLQLIYRAEDVDRVPTKPEEPEPMGFVWGEDIGEEAENETDDDAPTGSLIEEYWK